jgi:hypothetical protein
MKKLTFWDFILIITVSFVFSWFGYYVISEYFAKKYKIKLEPPPPKSDIDMINEDINLVHQDMQKALEKLKTAALQMV